MLKIAAIAAAIIATATPALTEEQIKVAGDETCRSATGARCLTKPCSLADCLATWQRMDR